MFFRLSGYESTLLGFTSRLHPIIKKLLKENKEDIEVICFGMYKKQGSISALLCSALLCFVPLYCFDVVLSGCLFVCRFVCLFVCGSIRVHLFDCAYVCACLVFFYSLCLVYSIIIAVYYYYYYYYYYSSFSGHLLFEMSAGYELTAAEPETEQLVSCRFDPVVEVRKLNDYLLCVNVSICLSVCLSVCLCSVLASGCAVAFSARLFSSAASLYRIVVFPPCRF